jgi:hypothetical protein
MIAVLADQHMDVVGHDGTAVAGVFAAVDDLLEGFADEFYFGIAEGQERVFQDVAGFLVEFADFSACCFLRPWWSSPNSAIGSTRISCNELPRGSLGSHQP